MFYDHLPQPVSPLIRRNPNCEEEDHVTGLLNPKWNPRPHCEAITALLTELQNSFVELPRNIISIVLNDLCK